MTVLREETPTLSQVLQQAMESRLVDVHTALPASIVSYDSGTNLAQVQCEIKRKYVDEDARNLPIITNVPVVHPRANDAMLYLPIKAGDHGLVIFSERSIDLWIERGAAVDPEDARKFHLSDAIFVPGLYPKTKPMPAKVNPSELTLVNSSSVLELQAGGKIKISNDSADLVDMVQQIAQALVAEPFIINKGTFGIIAAKLSAMKV